jgi:hypothetical protein
MYLIYFKIILTYAILIIQWDQIFVGLFFESRINQLPYSNKWEKHNSM